MPFFESFLCYSCFWPFLPYYIYLYSNINLNLLICNNATIFFCFVLLYLSSLCNHRKKVNVDEKKSGCIAIFTRWENRKNFASIDFNKKDGKKTLFVYLWSAIHSILPDSIVLMRSKWVQPLAISFQTKN